MKKKIIVAALICIMCFSGCGNQHAIKRDEPAVSFTNTKYEPITLGEYTAFTRFLQSVQYTQYQKMYQQYVKQSGENSDNAVMSSVWDVFVNSSSDSSYSESEASSDATSSESVKSSSDDGKAIQEANEGDVLKNLSADYLTEFVLSARHADDYKLKFSDSEEKLVDKAVDDYYNANQKAIEYDGYTKDDVKAFLTDYTLFAKVADAVRKHADVSVTDEESKVADLSYIYVSYGTGENDLSKDKAAAIADKILKDVENGVDMASESDMYNQTTASSVSMAPLDKTQSYVFSDADLQKIADAKSGTVIPEVLEGNDNKLYVIKVTENGDQTKWNEYKLQLLENKQMAVYDDLYEKWAEEAGIKYNEDAIRSVLITDKVIFREKGELSDSSSSSVSESTASSDEISSSDSSKNIDK